MSRPVTVYLSRETEDDEVEIVVSCRVHPGDPGRTYGEPSDCYPPEPAEVDIVSATLGGVAVDLTPREEGCVKERAIERVIADDADTDREPA
jgi:hypothetical protein